MRQPLAIIVLVAALLSACDQSKQGDAPPATGASSAASGAPATVASGGLTTSAASGAPVAPARSPVPRTFEGRGVYFTATTMVLPRYQTMMKQLKAAGGNMFVFDAKDEGGIVSWKSKVPLARAIKADADGPIRDLKAKVDEAHKLGIHVAGRIVCFNDPILAKKRKDLAVKRVGGGVWLENGYLNWVDPSLKENQDYIIDLAKEMAAAGVDEVQFDYIRFPAQGDTQNARYAFDPKKQQKHEIITAFTRRAYEELHPLGILVSADVYGIMAWAQPIDVRITGQQMEDMAKHLDVLSPMLYPSHFSKGFAGVANPADQPYMFMHKGLTLLNKKVEGTGVVIRPWMQAMPWRVSAFTPRYITEQLRAGRDTKATGYMMWNAQNRYDTAFAGMKVFHGKR